MTELKLKREMKKVVGTGRMLILGKPLAWNVQETYFVVYFSINEHRIRRVFKDRNFKFNRKLQVYWRNIEVAFKSAQEEKTYKVTLYWKKP